MLTGIKSKIITLSAITAVIAGTVSGISVICCKSCMESKKCRKAFKQIEDKLM